MAESNTEDPSRDGGAYQGETATEIALEYGYSPTRTHVDTHAKEDSSASPSSFPEIGPERHQHANGGPSHEASLCCGQTPCADLVARRYRQFLDDGGLPGRDPASYGEQFEH